MSKKQIKAFYNLKNNLNKNGDYSKEILKQEIKFFNLCCFVFFRLMNNQINNLNSLEMIKFKKFFKKFKILKII